MARLIAPLLSKPAEGISPALGRSRSATSAAVGSVAMTAIDPGRGPKPNRCNASAAPRGSRAMTFFLKWQKGAVGIKCDGLTYPTPQLMARQWRAGKKPMQHQGGVASGITGHDASSLEHLS